MTPSRATIDLVCFHAVTMLFNVVIPTQLLLTVVITTLAWTISFYVCYVLRNFVSLCIICILCLSMASLRRTLREQVIAFVMYYFMSLYLLFVIYTTSFVVTAPDFVIRALLFLATSVWARLTNAVEHVLSLMCFVLCLFISLTLKY